MANPHANTIKLQVFSAIAFVVVVFVLGYYVLPTPVPNLPTKVDRLMYTLQWQTISVLTLIAGIQSVGNTRFRTTAVDPINGRGEHLVAVDVRYVQNTLEQLVLNCFGQVILTTYLTEYQMRIIPILVFFFVSGRICFWIGYRKAFQHRSFGFALTFMPTLSTYIVLCVSFLNIGPLGK